MRRLLALLLIFWLPLQATAGAAMLDCASRMGTSQPAQSPLSAHSAHGGNGAAQAMPAGHDHAQMTHHAPAASSDDDASAAVPTGDDACDRCTMLCTPCLAAPVQAAALSAHADAAAVPLVRRFSSEPLRRLHRPPIARAA